MADTGMDMLKTKRILETSGMKILGKIAGRIPRCRKRSGNIEGECDVRNISEWLGKRKQEWNNRISRMEEGWVIEVAKDKSPVGKGSVGRIWKRWCHVVSRRDGMKFPVFHQDNVRPHTSIVTR